MLASERKHKNTKFISNSPKDIKTKEMQKSNLYINNVTKSVHGGFNESSEEQEKQNNSIRKCEYGKIKDNKTQRSNAGQEKEGRGSA
jgi:hypothetical protein